MTAGKNPHVFMLFVVFQVDKSRDAIKFEIETMNKNPDPEMLLTEMIHAVSKISHE